MGLENCQIYLDNPTATYTPGETVSGRVEFNFSSVKKVRGIEVHFLGKASTYWTEDESYDDSDGKSQTRSITYSASEDYYNIKSYLIGGKNNDAIEIPAGHHEYQISCALPSVLPSSFEGIYGDVRYTVTVTLIRPWKFNQSLKAAYTVVGPLDVNTNPRWREPATLTMEKYFCCLLCKSGPLTGILKVPYTGYVPGQVIPVTLEIDNVSNVPVLNTKIKLKKIVTFHSSSPTHRTKGSNYTITEIPTNFQVSGKESKVFSGLMAIPSLPPSNLSNCSIIDIDYEIRVTVIVEGVHRNMKGNLPITIGTIPLTNMVPMQPPPLQINDLDQLPSTIGWIPAPPNTPPIDMSLMPPPSYEECQFGAKTILDHGESEYTKLSSANWAPSYPVYHFDMYPNAPSASASGVSNGAPTATAPPL